MVSFFIRYLFDQITSKQYHNNLTSFPTTALTEANIVNLELKDAGTARKIAIVTFEPNEIESKENEACNEIGKLANIPGFRKGKAPANVIRKKYSREIKEELTVKVDNYLNYVVEQWMTDNELAIEKGIKGEIAEDFIAGLKTLFEDHYIDVPDEKYDVLEAKEKELEEMKSKVNEMTEKAVSDKKTIEGYTKDEIFESAVEGMADTEKEKMKSLVEDVAFEGADAYSKKLSTIKESYFGVAKEASASTENVDTIKDSNDGNIVADMSDSMSRYAAAISRGKSRDIYGK